MGWRAEKGNNMGGISVNAQYPMTGLTLRDYLDILHKEACGTADQDLGLQFAGAKSRQGKLRREALNLPAIQRRAVEMSPHVLKADLYNQALDMASGIREADQSLATLRQKLRLLRQSRYAYLS